MNKKELVSSIMKSTGYTQAVVRACVDATFEEIAKSMEAGEQVKIVGFGTFGTKERAARNGVSPKDRNKKILIEAKRVPSVHFGKVLKARVNDKKD